MGKIRDIGDSATRMLGGRVTVDLFRLSSYGDI